MYSQSKGRQFGPGEQIKLVEYLIQTCPLDPNQVTAVAWWSLILIGQPTELSLLIG